MGFEYYIESGTKRLRCGYSTGTCAALAAAGAAQLLLTGQAPELLSVVTPKGPRVNTYSEYCRFEPDGSAVCAVRKDAGDDPDITGGMLICARVSFLQGAQSGEEKIVIDGGEGVGRVTRPGLDQPPGSAAINTVPRRMIKKSVNKILEENGRTDRLKVVISIPGGREKAAGTFNPQLGIEGGLSVLGTSGIVEPMSTDALKETIRISLCQAACEGHKEVILAPGNYGLSYVEKLGIGGNIPVVRCSNFVGDALDMASVLGFEKVLLVGHAGKLVKLAGGIMNTHSSQADCRRELICAHAAVSGADKDLCSAIMEAVTTNECFDLLERAGLLDIVSERLMSAIDLHLARRAGGAYRAGALVFAGEERLIGTTKNAADILAGLKDWNAGKMSEEKP